MQTRSQTRNGLGSLPLLPPLDDEVCNSGSGQYFDDSSSNGDIDSFIESDLDSDIESDCDILEPKSKRLRSSVYVGLFMDAGDMGELINGSSRSHNQLISSLLSTDNLTTLSDRDSSDLSEEDEDELNDDLKDTTSEEGGDVSNKKVNQEIEFGKYSSKERRYLKTLDNNEAMYNINEDKRLTALYKQTMPMKFKIITANASDSQKAMLLHKYSQTKDMGSDEKARHMRWLDFAIRLPLGKFTSIPITNMSSNDDIRQFLDGIRSKMDSKIYGHKETKEQILKILAQWISKPSSKGNVIGIYGEKGVGKSKLIKEGVSNALGLPFAFVPLGGVNDGSLLNGHHVVYEGASFGKIAEILINTQTMNPVIFFDELDKVSKKFDTEIESILTHLTDPVQNEKFQDHYFNGIDLDLSKSLFVFSYNDESLISPILRDRMITIHVSGYGIEDKIQICQKHLIEEVASEFNIKRSDIIFSDDIIKKIVSRVDEEKGVRNLKRGIESIISSINIERYLGNTTLTLPIKITESHVNKYIKQKKTSVPLLNMYM